MINKNKQQFLSNIITIPEGKICDYVDSTFRNDTPEEYVRQTIEKRLVNEHKYPIDQIEVEFTIKQATKKPRVDLAIFPINKTHLQENISIIIECKEERILPSDRKEGIEQLKSYMAASVNCEWGMWTNGKHKQVFRKISENDQWQFKEHIDIPSTDTTLEEIDRPKRNNLKKASDNNLLFVFKTCHNHIYTVDGYQKQQAFFEFLKVIFCKILDEQNVPKGLEFYITSNELNNQDGQLTAKNRIEQIFERVKKKYPKIFDPVDRINLKPRSLAYVILELQKYSLLETNIDIKGKAYEELVGANLRGDRGEFFTPRNIMRMAVEMISPKLNEKICDPACGTGGFLVLAMNYVTEQLYLEAEKEFGKKRFDWNEYEKDLMKSKVTDIAANNFFGFDINPDLVKATKMNMVMNNDGSGNILQNDSLLPPHEWENEFKEKLAKALGLNSKEIVSSNNIEFFDVIITNPPFGSKLPIRDHHILEQYVIGYIWKNEQYEIKGKKHKSDEWSITSKLQSSSPPEQLFIERCLQFLKPGGRLAIVLPDAILGAPGLGYIRRWLLQRTRIIASIDLHADTFQPRNGTQTSILILQKKSEKEIAKEEKHNTITDYNIFMAIIDKVGHDKRGNPVFKRDKFGNEILIPDDDVNIIEMGHTSDWKTTVKRAAKKRVLNDQTPLIPEIFSKWKKNEGINW